MLIDLGKKSPTARKHWKKKINSSAVEFLHFTYSYLRELKSLSLSFFFFLTFGRHFQSLLILGMSKKSGLQYHENQPTALGKRSRKPTQKVSESVLEKENVSDTRRDVVEEEEEESNFVTIKIPPSPPPSPKRSLKYHVDNYTLKKEISLSLSSKK